MVYLILLFIISELMLDLLSNIKWSYLLIGTMASWNIYSFTAIISLTCAVLSIPIKPRLIFLWFHKLASIYNDIFIGFVMEWIYLIVLRYAQGFSKDPLIKGDCKYKSPYILGHIVDLSRPHLMDCMVRGFQVRVTE